MVEKVMVCIIFVFIVIIVTTIIIIISVTVSLSIVILLLLWLFMFLLFYFGMAEYNNYQLVSVIILLSCYYYDSYFCYFSCSLCYHQMICSFVIAFVKGITVPIIVFIISNYFH